MTGYDLVPGEVQGSGPNERPANEKQRRMPIYEFECEECGARFEELVASAEVEAACEACGSKRTRRLISNVSPAGRQPRGATVRSDESRRREREAARQGRIAEARKGRE
jgi:putative FmdB family regulatory protein